MECGGALHSDCKLDWLAFTFFGDDPNGILSRFDYFKQVWPEFNSLIETGIYVKARNNYEFSLALSDSICISFDSSETNKGVNVSISGSGLYDFYCLLGSDDAIEIFKLIRSRNSKVSRMDIAFDDYSKTFCPADFFHWWDKGCLITDLRSGHYYFSSTKRGHTFDLGRRHSGKFLRIYDKEYESNGEIPSIRYEFELHREKADFVIDYIIDHDGIRFADICSMYFRIVDADNQVNKSHCKVLREWEEFLKVEFCELIPVKIPNKHINKSIQTFREWISRCRKPLAIALNLLGQEKFIDWLKSTELDEYTKKLVIENSYNKEFMKLIE